MATRRAILTTGAASAVVAAAGIAAYAWAPGLSRAREPWRAAGESFGDPRLDALAFAILAPNPHNKQPWAFELSGETGLNVYCNLARRLPETDPPDRQITIGFGCMLELMRIAAAANGYALEVAAFPDGESYPRLDARRVASVEFVRGAAAADDPLFSGAAERRTSRAAFDDARPVSQTTLDAVLAAARAPGAGGTLDVEKIEALKDIADRAWIIEYENPPTRRESIDVIRIGNRAVDENPDGIALGGTAMGLMKMAGLVSAEALDTPSSVAYQSGLESYRKAIATAAGFVWLIAEENTRATQLDAGRAWVRMNLAANAQGLSIHPLSQALQEFPEMAGPYAEIHNSLGAAGDKVVHMLARVGYGPSAPPSPRWPLQSTLRAPR